MLDSKTPAHLREWHIQRHQGYHSCSNRGKSDNSSTNQGLMSTQALQCFLEGHELGQALSQQHLLQLQELNYCSPRDEPKTRNPILVRLLAWGQCYANPRFAAILPELPCILPGLFGQANPSRRDHSCIAETERNNPSVGSREKTTL